MAINKTVTNTLADNAVTSAKINDGAVTNAKISDATTISITKTLINALPPTVTSLDTSVINPATGATVTITGTRFVSIPDVRFLNTTTGARITPSSVGFTSSTTITATFPSGQTAGIYKVIVENPNGLSVISSATITYSIAPAWSTAAGSLGSFEEGDSVSASLLAYDDDSTAVSSYSLVSGSLPSGITLSGDSSIGALTGTAPEVNADTQYSFTIRATDNESQTSDRAFTMDITNWGVFNSLRFDETSGDYLSKASFGTPTSTKKSTISFWCKRSLIEEGIIFMNDSATFPITKIYFDSSHRFSYIEFNPSVYIERTTNAVFRDVSAWYHIVVATDTTQATANDRVKVYINGVQETSFSTSTTPAQDTNLLINNNLRSAIGGSSTAGTDIFEGYISEILRVDGQQLTPSSFGETDATSGIWVPKKISGLTFGTNGFHLKFANSGALGTDSSGNSTNFTVNNLTSIDQVTDTPQNNFATMNPIASQAGSTSGPSGVTFENGNLDVGNISGETAIANIGVDTGKWYWEVKVLTDQDGLIIGAVNQDYNLDAELGYNSPSSPSTAKVFGYYGGNGTKTTSVDDGSGFGAYGSSIAVNDIVGVALNLDDNEVTFYKNGSSQGTFSINALGSGEVYFPAVGNWSVATIKTAFNFGNPSFTISSGNADANGYGNFEYAVPSGYYALNTKNLAQYG